MYKTKVDDLITSKPDRGKVRKQENKIPMIRANAHHKREPFAVWLKYNWINIPRRAVSPKEKFALVRRSLMSFWNWITATIKITES